MLFSRKCPTEERTFLRLGEMPCKIRAGNCGGRKRPNKPRVEAGAVTGTLVACHQKCKLKTECKIFIYRHTDGLCFLHRASARDGCTSSVEGLKENDMYSVEPCESGEYIFNRQILFIHTSACNVPPLCIKHVK